ncbi:ORP1_2 [Mytilus edulis]|uniref:Oxysterol-binding protein n=1 Tax=Mytilus edulis TaxID=6550 RepID=A0A8S3U885_MYTED|nr:ORP1_2 [Mytilus edulis]
MDMKSVTNFDAMSYQSADSGNFTCNKSPNCDIPKNGRTKLPVPMFDRNDFSIWSILKQCIGKRISEYLEYAKLLEQANLSDDPVERLSHTLMPLAVSHNTISSNWERIGKPFNPLLGETYEFSRPDLGFKIVSEQVSHHPPVSAFHAESPHFKIHGSIYPKLKFWGKSVEVNPKGLITLELLRHGETYTWSNINCCVHNYGPMEVINHKTKHKALLNFKQGGWFGRDLHKVEGFIYDSNKKKVKALYGSWVLDMYSVPADIYEQHMSESVNHQPCQHKDKVSMSQHKDKVSSIDKVSSMSQHQDKVSSMSQHKDKVSMSQHKDKVSSMSQHKDKVSMSQHRDKVSMSQHKDKVSMSQHKDKVCSMSQHNDKVSSMSQHKDKVSMSQHKDKVSSMSQHKDKVSMSQHKDKVCSMSQHNDKVSSMSQHKDKVSMSQHKDKVSSMSQHKDKVSMSQHKDKVSSMSQHKDKVSMSQHKDNGVVCHNIKIK